MKDQKAHGASPITIDRSSNEGFAITAWGEQCRLRLPSATTLSRLAILDYRAPPRFGPPRHSHHNDDEIFLVQEGTIVIWTPQRCSTAGLGDVVYLPKQVPHTWRAFGELAVRFQVTVSPGDFVSFFEAIVELGLSLDQVDELRVVAHQAGMTILGPPLTDDEVGAIVAATIVP